MTENLLAYLVPNIGFLSFYNNYEQLFEPFISLCKNPILFNPYQLHNIFRECQKKVELFLSNLDPALYYEQTNTYVVQYIQKNGKIPFFLELLLQVNSFERYAFTENNTNVVIEL